MHGLGGAGIETQRNGVGCIVRSVDRMPSPKGGRSQPIMSATNVSKMHAMQMEWDHVWLSYSSEYAGVEWHWVDCFYLQHSVSGWIAVLIGVMEHGIDDRVDIGVCNWAIHLGPVGC
jgi:hypothetical protein